MSSEYYSATLLCFLYLLTLILFEKLPYSQEKAAGGCHICKRIWALLQIHARQCKQKNCPVPKCMAIRDHSRRIALQQQAMDDRRRQEMNRTYAAATAAR
mmetsp:Transcript_18018/g.40962  ORF Transcript_18018/g.40962 Transcript_18018/m.40962 type:complete len:100 (-) Transcript_18018:211-510(-)